jgi:hypothetical protein
MKDALGMSRKIRLAVLLVALLPAAAHAQEQLDAAASARLKEQAEACSRAFIEGDFGRLADYTHPKVVEMMGGREKMAEFVRKDTAEMKSEGYETLSYALSEPTQVLREGRETYAVLPAKLRIRTPAGVYVAESFMIGLSADDGRSWKFVSGASADPATLKILFPAEAVSKLKLPTVRNYPEDKKAP